MVGEVLQEVLTASAPPAGAGVPLRWPTRPKQHQDQDGDHNEQLKNNGEWWRRTRERPSMPRGSWAPSCGFASGVY